ncbi:aldehyde dehydrogenase family protein [Salmonella enterica subsp. enterica]|nr:aldehyde dehydrogenase family protein [Salmonella enterica subsp. enterica]
MEEALEIANDTQYGSGAGVRSRNGNSAYKMGRGIQAGAYGLTAITPIRHMLRSAAISSRASGAKPHKMMLEQLPANRACW